MSAQKTYSAKFYNSTSKFDKLNYNLFDIQNYRKYNSSSLSLVVEDNAVGDSCPVHKRVTDKSYSWVTVSLTDIAQVSPPPASACWSFCRFLRLALLSLNAAILSASKRFTHCLIVVLHLDRSLAMVSQLTSSISHCFILCFKESLIHFLWPHWWRSPSRNSP